VCQMAGTVLLRGATNRHKVDSLLPTRSRVFGPRLIRTEVWSRDGVLLQTASRHSHPVDKYRLCGTRLINNYFVETNRRKVVRRRRTQTMSRQFLSGGHRRIFCARDVKYSMHSTESAYCRTSRSCTLPRVHTVLDITRTENPSMSAGQELSGHCLGTVLTFGDL
jgi:hypothetical protein